MVRWVDPVTDGTTDLGSERVAGLVGHVGELVGEFRGLEEDDPMAESGDSWAIRCADHGVHPP
jgi:hypothetical protein